MSRMVEVKREDLTLTSPAFWHKLGSAESPAQQRQTK